MRPHGGVAELVFSCAPCGSPLVGRAAGFQSCGVAALPPLPWPAALLLAQHPGHPQPCMHQALLLQAHLQGLESKFARFLHGSGSISPRYLSVPSCALYMSALLDLQQWAFIHLRGRTGTKISHKQDRKWVRAAPILAFSSFERPIDHHPLSLGNEVVRTRPQRSVSPCQRWAAHPGRPGPAACCLQSCGSF